MFINRRECKKYLLDMSQKYRNGKFKRVGKDVYEHLDFTLQRVMIQFVRSHPSLGVTLKTGVSKREEYFKEKQNV